MSRAKRIAVALSAVVVFASAAAHAQKPKPGAKPPKPPPAAKPPAGGVKPPPPPPPPPAEKPKFVDVTVVEVAAGRAYLQPGAKELVRRGATVTVRNKEYKVIDATDSYAVILIADDANVREKDKGRSTIVEEEEGNKPPPAPPRPLSTWQTAWTPQAPPADTEENVRFVPLGGQARDRRYDVRIGMTSGGYIPLDSRGASLGYVSIDARLHAAPFSVPLALDFDGSVRVYGAGDLSSRVGASTRSIVLVRELMLSYGRAGSWYAGLGRMRYAASTLGSLDGLRLEAPIAGGVSVAGFGGFVPNPLGGQVSPDAQRFGVELKFARPESKLRPEAALVAHGSMFGGRPDERRLSAVFGIYPGKQRFGGHVEVSNFDADNPWKANAVEVTAAGVDSGVRVGPFDFGARFDVIQPERSRWLASFLPTSWFCRTVPGSGPTPQTEVCDGRSSMRATGAVDAGITVGNFSFMASGNMSGDVTHTASNPRVYGAFGAARLVRIAKVLRLEATASWSDASVLRMGTGSGGVGLTLFDEALDVSVYYRRGQLLYSSLNGFVHHDSVGGMVAIAPHPTLLFTVQAEGTGGSDSNALYLFGTALFRPRL